MKPAYGIVVTTLLFGLVACSAQRHDMGHGGSAPAERTVLYDSLGSYSYLITTASPETQRWFDQGLRLVYAFNHHEAQKAFREAARLDPGCAMCYWGVALTEGSNYNSPTDGDREKKALAAVQDATRLAAGASPRERALIQAIAKRHAAGPGAERAALDRAYADAMREVAREFPDDLSASGKSGRSRRAWSYASSDSG